MITSNRIIGIFFVLLFVISRYEEEKYANEHKVNYLNYRTVSLKNHTITNNLNEKMDDVLLLGTSSLAGSNIPRNSTIVDFLNRNSSESSKNFYNLGMLEGSLMESLIFLRLAEKVIKPEFVIVGISPDMFLRSFDSIPIASNFSEISSLLPKELNMEVQNRLKNKLYLPTIVNFLSETSLPYKFILNLKEYFYFQQIKYFGNAYDFHVHEGKPIEMAFLNETANWLDLLDVLKNYCREKNIKFAIYLEPHLAINTFYQQKDLEKYNYDLKNYLVANKIEYLDYTNVVPKNSQYFIDYNHLTPKGNELVANLIKSDLIGVAK